MTLKARIENGIVYSPYPSEPVPEMTFYQVVKHSLEQYGCRTALVWNDEEITFAELLKMCQQYAAGFQRHGVKKGEKVLVHLDNSLENMIALYSVVFAGGVFVASHLILSDDDILYRIRDSNAAHILTTTSEAKRFSNLRNKMDVKGNVLRGAGDGNGLGFRQLGDNTSSSASAPGASDAASAPSRAPPASPSNGLRPSRSPCRLGESTFFGFFHHCHSLWRRLGSRAYLCGVVLAWDGRVLPQHGRRAALCHAGAWQVTADHTVLDKALR
ncbi:4-coumarate--CoA ligase 1-like [Ixodes scapularis]